jgi:rhodanese-related sulfurtransferase
MCVSSAREHLAAVKRHIREISPAEASEQIGNGGGPAILDVRERDEYEQGYIPGAVHIPRGFLESRI